MQPTARSSNEIKHVDAIALATWLLKRGANSSNGVHLELEASTADIQLKILVRHVRLIAAALDIQNVLNR